MDLTVPAELDALCRTVRAFVDREVDPVIPEIEETDRVPEAVLAKARELGLFGMGIPEEYVEHQMVQAMIAEMAADTAAARALTRHAAWMADREANVAKEASMAKLFASEALARVADKAVQIHGGMGYMKEMAVERFYRDARITRIYEGSSEIQKLIIARAVIEEN